MAPKIFRVCMAAVAIQAWGAHSTFAQPVNRIVVPTQAGGLLDGVARQLARSLNQVNGETYLVENRPGAQGKIAIEHVLAVPGDGRTLLMGSSYLITNAEEPGSTFRIERDLLPVMPVARTRNALVVTQTLSVQHPGELPAAAKSKPGGLNCAATGGEYTLGCQQLNSFLQGAVIAVPFSGLAPAMSALMGGHIDLMFAPFETALQLHTSNKARVIAAAGRDPLPEPFEKLPRLEATWPEVEITGFVGLFVTSTTAAKTLENLRNHSETALGTDEMKAFFAQRGLQPMKPDAQVLSDVVNERRVAVKKVRQKLGISN